MIPAFQYYFPNVLDGINQKHLNYTSHIANPPCETTTEALETTTEMLIDDKYLGKIIGKGGRRIDQIRSDSNTKITIYRQLYNSKRRVVILGNLECIQKAKTNILQLCC
jgi:predicted RNA-binding protein YlqC (UPF0109 family)